MNNVSLLVQKSHGADPDEDEPHLHTPVEAWIIDINAAELSDSAHNVGHKGLSLLRTMNAHKLSMVITSLIPAAVGYRQADLCEAKARLVYTVSSRSARAI